ncbi:MAG: hypothetical protein J6O04_03440 [Selenomonadaceae bacterium]|nr:hypothetical protein [Selenomonadaceae bacterium]
MEIIDIKVNRVMKCAFCKNWYDPTNSAIKPRSSALWEYDPRKRSRCLERNTETAGNYGCGKFEMKML